jgi:hypothetical protein
MLCLYAATSAPALLPPPRIGQAEPSPARVRAPPGASSLLVCASRAMPPSLYQPPQRLPPTAMPSALAASSYTAPAQRRHPKQAHRRNFSGEIRPPRCTLVVSKVWNRIPASASFICPAPRDLPCTRMPGIRLTVAASHHESCCEAFID